MRSGAIFLLMLFGATLPLGAQTKKRLRPSDLHGRGFRMLLHQFRADEPRSLGDYVVAGRQVKERYAGELDLPPGIWVWARPYWYIYERRAEERPEHLAWSAEQAAGPPNSPAMADQKTAWASKAPDGGSEWLMLEFSRPVATVAIVMYQTFNPGAVRRVLVYDSGGRANVVYERKALDRAAKKRVLRIPVVAQRTMRVRIELATKWVQSWNEIDAVGLVDKDGKTLWAESAVASSWYRVDRKAIPAAAAAAPALPAAKKDAAKQAARKRVRVTLAKLQAKLAATEAELAVLKAQIAAERKKLQALR